MVLPLTIMLADLHVHTNLSRDSDMTLAEIQAACRSKGLGCVAITDHNHLENALRAPEVLGITVIPGEEIMTAAGEIIGYFLSEPVPPGLSPQETVRRIKAQGGLVCLPHPFDRLRNSRLKTAELELILGDVDMIEIANARTTLARDNAAAQRFARAHGLPGSAGSDAHTPGEIGRTCLEMAVFASKEQFLESLRGAQVQGGRSLPTAHLATTWIKISKRLRRWR
ncbi:MAG: PHP domain-containing protein [Chloroflexi bacterium]|nr:PHP domain-containing protein [Chloroflexota bacterium]